MYWLKLAHGAPANPKWRAIAAAVGCPTGHVWTLYTWVLDFAGQHDGSLSGFDLDEVAAGTDYPIAELQRIWAEFARKLIVAGDALKNWAKHQGANAIAAAQATAAKIESAVSAAALRQRRARARRDHAARQGDLFAGVTEGVTSVTSGVTCHAPAAPPPAPPPREYIKKPPYGPPGGGARRAPGQNLPVFAETLRQGEILLPLEGRRRRMTPAERRTAERRAAIAEGVAMWEAKHGVAA